MQQNTFSKDDKIIVGYILTPHGIKGHVRIKSIMQNASNIFFTPLLDEKNTKIKLELLFKKQNIFICKLNDISNRDLIEPFNNSAIYTLRSNLPTIIDQNNEFYHKDLINLPVIDINTKIIGSVIGIHNFGASDIIEIKCNDSTKKMLPFKKNIFIDVKPLKHIMIDLTSEDLEYF